MKSFKELRIEAKQVWDKPNPKAERGESEKLSSSAKARARARAKAAGRPYPNMVDNIWAARNEEAEIAEAQFEVGHAHNKTTRMTYSDIQAKNAKDAIAKSQNKSDHNLVHVYNKDTGTFHHPETGRKMQDQFNEAPAWTRKEGKSPSGGLNAKGIASYRRENPGSKLSMAVTTPPSKLKPGGKAANRRKSFCARMSGVEGPMKKPNGEPTRKALALRKWNC